MNAAALTALAATVRANPTAHHADAVQFALREYVCMAGCCDTATMGMGRSVTARYCDRHAPKTAKPLVGAAAIRVLAAWLDRTGEFAA